MDPAGLIVVGETEDGQGFRPGVCSERLMDAAAAYGQDRRQRRDFCAGPDRRRRQTEFLTAKKRGSTRPQK